MEYKEFIALETPEWDKPVYVIKVWDLQAEAGQRLGRLLTDDELETFKKKLQWGLGETMGLTYDAIFEEYEK